MKIQQIVTRPKKIQQCGVCKHSQLYDINRDYFLRLTLRQMAPKYGLSIDALQRHKKHLPIELIEKQETKDKIHALDLNAELLELMETAKRLLKRAEHVEKLAEASNFVGRTTSLIELIAKMTGKMPVNTPAINIQNNVNLYESQEYIDMKKRLIEVLKHQHPEALKALLKASEPIKQIEI